MRTMIALMAAVLMIGFSAPAKAETKIAVVDIEKLLNESSAGKSIAKQIQEKQASVQKEFSAKEKELQDAQTKLIEEKKSLSAEDFAKKRKEFEEKLIETRKLFQKRRTDLDRGLNNALLELRKNVVETTAAIAEKEKVDVVLTRDSVVIAEKALDITDQVLKELNTKISNIKLAL